MPIKHISMALVVVALLAIGQVLFKSVADSVRPEQTSVAAVFGFIQNPLFLGAIVIYAVATVAWIFVLTQTPLNVAYPIMALAFVLVPVLSMIILGESISPKTIIGSLIIVSGITICHT